MLVCVTGAALFGKLKAKLYTGLRFMSEAAGTDPTMKGYIKGGAVSGLAVYFAKDAYDRHFSIVEKVDALSKDVAAVDKTTSVELAHMNGRLGAVEKELSYVRQELVAVNDTLKLLVNKK